MYTLLYLKTRHLFSLNTISKLTGSQILLHLSLKLRSRCSSHTVLLNNIACSNWNLPRFASNPGRVITHDIKRCSAIWLYSRLIRQSKCVIGIIDLPFKRKSVLLLKPGSNGIYCGCSGSYTLTHRHHDGTRGRWNNGTRDSSNLR